MTNSHSFVTCDHPATRLRQCDACDSLPACPPRSDPGQLAFGHRFGCRGYASLSNGKPHRQAGLCVRARRFAGVLGVTTVIACHSMSISQRPCTKDLRATDLRNSYSMVFPFLACNSRKILLGNPPPPGETPSLLSNPGFSAVTGCDRAGVGMIDSPLQTVGPPFEAALWRDSAQSCPVDSQCAHVVSAGKMSC